VSHARNAPMLVVIGLASIAAAGGCGTTPRGGEGAPPEPQVDSDPSSRSCDTNIVSCGDSCAFSPANTCLGACGKNAAAGGFRLNLVNNTGSVLTVTRVDYGSNDVPCLFWRTNSLGAFQGPDTLRGVVIHSDQNYQFILVRMALDRCERQATSQCAVVDAACGTDGSWDTSWTMEFTSANGGVATVKCSLVDAGGNKHGPGFLECSTDGTPSSDSFSLNIEPKDGVEGDRANFTAPNADLSVAFTGCRGNEPGGSWGWTCSNCKYPSCTQASWSPSDCRFCAECWNIGESQKTAGCVSNCKVAEDDDGKLVCTEYY
jgi:hypothetical protein